jgi:pimeloyl-ACP methyl ester carboxylesterase
MQSTTFSITSGGQTLRISAKVRMSCDDLVLFVHGLGCAKECFDTAFTSPQLRQYAICTFDLPSHGWSDQAEGASVEMLANVTSRIVDTLGSSRVYLVCHSMGGAVGLVAATRYLPQCSFFISVEGNLVGRDCGTASRSIASQPLSMFVRTGFDHFVASLQADERPDRRTWGRWCARCDPAGLRSIAASLVAWSDSGRLSGLFTAMPRRAYIYGERSELSYLWPTLAGTPTYAVPRSGHFPMIDNPRAFYSLLGEILRTPQPVAVRPVAAPASALVSYGGSKRSRSYSP